MWRPKIDSILRAEDERGEFLYRRDVPNKRFYFNSSDNASYLLALSEISELRIASGKRNYTR